MGNGFVFSIQVVFVEPLSLSPPELHALHRAIMSAKFTPNPVDPAINGSPHIASVANRVLDLIIEVEQESSERVVLWGGEQSTIRGVNGRLRLISSITRSGPLGIRGGSENL